MSKCILCGKDYNYLIDGFLCYPCKEKQDNLDFKHELEQYVKDMLNMYHKGYYCWIKTNMFCQEGYCSNCIIYQEAGIGQV
jgi:hypothetical protein